MEGKALSIIRPQLILVTIQYYCTVHRASIQAPISYTQKLCNKHITMLPSFDGLFTKFELFRFVLYEFLSRKPITVVLMLVYGTEHFLLKKFPDILVSICF